MSKNNTLNEKINETYSYFLEKEREKIKLKKRENSRKFEKLIYNSEFIEHDFMNLNYKMDFNKRIISDKIKNKNFEILKIMSDNLKNEMDSYFLQNSKSLSIKEKISSLKKKSKTFDLRIFSKIDCLQTFLKSKPCFIDENLKIPFDNIENILSHQKELAEVIYYYQLN